MCEEYGNEICIHPLDSALFARYLDTLSFILIYVHSHKLNARSLMSVHIHELLNIGTCIMSIYIIINHNKNRVKKNVR